MSKTKNAKTTTKKSSSKKSKSSGDKLTKEVLAATEANLARIEAAEGGETPPPTSEGDVAPVQTPNKPKGRTPKADKPKKEKPAKKTSLLDHAVETLKKSKEPLTCKEIVERVMATSDWKTNGKTPWATLYSAIIREIAEKKADSRFKKMDRGMFSFNA